MIPSEASLYVVVEGERTEPALFRAWLPLLLPGIRPVERIEDASPGSYYLIVGGGYPSYQKRIRAAIQDIRKQPGFSHLVVAVDSEEASRADREAEILEFAREQQPSVPVRVLVADCCVETWFLGNRRVVSRNPQDLNLRQYLGYYPVYSSDPEQMGSNQERTRAQFHCKYLKAVFRERGLSYRKDAPGEVLLPPYFQELCARARVETAGRRHLASFQELVDLPEWVRANPPAPSQPVPGESRS